MNRAPSDWPGPGPIDLDTHEAPHASATLEWWYVNGHLTTERGEALSYFASFFRTAVSRDQQTGRYVYAHALAWALVDPARRRYLAESLVDHDSPEIARRQLEKGLGGRDALLRRAMLEVLERGHVPRPDILLPGPVAVAQEHLSLNFDGRRFLRRTDGSYTLELRHGDGGVGCTLHLQPRKPFVRHGDMGVVRGRHNEDMFYYFCPRLEVNGTVVLDGETRDVAHGQGWYDHEFGYSAASQADDELLGAGGGDVSWDWLSAQFDDGTELSLYCLTDRVSGHPAGRWAVVIPPDGAMRRYQDFSLSGGGEWTSSKTYIHYPTSWRVQIPEAGIDLCAEAVFPNQEFVTVLSKPAFWEGRVHVRGTVAGRSATGLGFVERSGSDADDSVERFLNAVGRATRASVRDILPLELDHASAAMIVCREDRPQYVEGLDLGQVARTLVEPVRTVVDRGGKAWRSAVLLACCDVVGGDSQDLLPWLAMPELIHVGSLIVDDVQDRSMVRRGGPAVHCLYGEALAITAGSACYFVPYLFVSKISLSDADRLSVYDLYFEGVRAAHAGQALDIDGFDRHMPRIVADGDAETVRRHVRAVHRLKSAVPASCLGRIGVVLGRGTPEQEQAVGQFLEALGIAFQIMDDVLNLAGFKGDLKTQGEDIHQCKVTMPVATAMGRLDAPGRRRLWDILTARTEDPALVAEAIALIEGCGALDACRAEAEALVEAGWARLEPLLPDSHAKLQMRAFGWYILDRHY